VVIPANGVFPASSKAWSKSTSYLRRNAFIPTLGSTSPACSEEQRREPKGLAGLGWITRCSAFIGEIVSAKETAEPTSVASLTAEIVSAYVSNNQIAIADLAGLITTVAGQLSKVGAEPEQPADEKSKPAVSVRRSVRPDQLICLICGKPQKMLKRHLTVQHELTPAEYRERFGLKPDYPMAAPNYVQQRREVALATGLGRPKKPARRGRKAGARPRPEQSRRTGDDASA
jgi:predicted transcriptional regulator